MSLPVCQLHSQGVLPLAGQLVDVLVPQPVLSRHAPKTLRRQRTETRFSMQTEKKNKNKKGKKKALLANHRLREDLRHMCVTSKTQLLKLITVMEAKLEPPA